MPRLPCCLKCNYSLLCVDYERVDIVRCARCGETRILLAIIYTASRRRRELRSSMTEKVCDVFEGLDCACRGNPLYDKPHTDYLHATVCDKCIALAGY